MHEKSILAVYKKTKYILSCLLAPGSCHVQETSDDLILKQQTRTELANSKELLQRLGSLG